MIDYLIPSEIAVLRALADGLPRCSLEIAELTDLPAWSVRSICKALGRRRLLQHGRTMHDAGRWWITEYGTAQLARLSQLKLIRP